MTNHYGNVQITAICINSQKQLIFQQVRVGSIQLCTFFNPHKGQDEIRHVSDEIIFFNWLNLKVELKSLVSFKRSSGDLKAEVDELLK